ncbi:hypothetical protein AMECASPLE_028332 [Ameca splendens]|uniref:Uncharacterized protein n=1 Tax=Ameca splendens TaxID=208324 RepID=A0ABV0ZQA9_9TELE
MVGGESKDALPDTSTENLSYFLLEADAAFPRLHYALHNRSYVCQYWLTNLLCSHSAPMFSSTSDASMKLLQVLSTMSPFNTLLLRGPITVFSLHICCHIILKRCDRVAKKILRCDHKGPHMFPVKIINDSESFIGLNVF